MATTRLHAQGISTAGVNGVVRSEGGELIDGARVVVRNTATGYSLETTTRRGMFYARGLEVGGPYQVAIRALGYAPLVRDSLLLHLGDPAFLEFALSPAAQSLDAVRVSEESSGLRSAQTGPSTTIPGSLLHGLPSLNRDMYDFVRLAPQVSARLNGVTGGTNIRLNGYLIDGVSDRQLGSNSVMGGARGGKSMPIDALKEYQVLLSPYDARYGDFAGLLVNAVTKSGTNRLEGSAFGYMRNDRLARQGGFLGGSGYQRWQYGLSLGGPIVRDRVHFFVASEFQEHAEPSLGPYLGQADDAPAPVPVAPESVERFVSALRAYGLEAGDGDRVTLENPVTSFFGRLDVAMPEWRSRLALRYTYSDVERSQFGRPATGRVFPLSSNAWSLQLTKRSAALQLFTQPAPRLFNELLVGYSTVPNGAARYTDAPTISAAVPNVAGNATALLVAGPPEMGQGTHIVNTSVEVADHLAVQLDDQHAVSVGVRGEWLRYHGSRVPGSFGRWMFTSLDALERGEAQSYGVARDFGAASTPLNGLQLGAYVNDEWRPADGVMITAGLRADLLSFDARPVYNSGIESVLGRRTSDFPRSLLHWSPRVGFSWEPAGSRRTRARGGIGLFAGRPPLGWLRSPLRQYGTGIRTLTCTAITGRKVVPDFTPDPRFQPGACADGTPSSSGGVDLVDRNLRMGEALRTTLAVDQQLPGDIVATAEAMYTRHRSDFLLVNMKLRGPQGVDRHGRVMYGTIGPTGARPAFVAGTDTIPEIIDLRNQSHAYSWSLTGQLTKRFSAGLEARGSYTYAVMRDVQSLVDNPAGNAVRESWAGSRALSGRHDDLSPTISSFDVPHRVVLAAVYTAPWRRWATDISLAYIGESGVRYTYLDSSAMGFGDLNADGTSANDPIYVPRSALDPAEILFRGEPDDVERQQIAFEQFIADTPCLRRQRGRIVERNSCLAPWVHSAHISVRQALPQRSGHRLALQLDVFNVLNLLDSRWGLMRTPNVNVLEHVEQTPGALDVSRSIFRFNPAVRRYSTANAESSYQIQVAARYSF